MVSLCLTWDVSLFHRWWICSIQSPHILYIIYHDYCLYQLTSGGGPPYLDGHICVSWYLYISWCTWIIFVFRHQNIFLWHPATIYFPWCGCAVMSCRSIFLCSLTHLGIARVLPHNGGVTSTFDLIGYPWISRSHLGNNPSIYIQFLPLNTQVIFHILAWIIGKWQYFQILYFMQTFWM